MAIATTSSSPTPTFRRTAQEWDEVRRAFHTSIMIDTGLSSLAQNLDGPPWPLPGADETPSKYIDLTFPELCAVCAGCGHPELVDRLVSILKDTLAFDDPFGDMVEHSTAAAERDNPLLKNLERLRIPATFPLALANLSIEAREICALEKLTTLGEFALAAQAMAARAIVGGDFRRLLNALATSDEAVLAELLPFRPGAIGLHLPEALAQCVRRLPVETRAAFARRASLVVPPAELAPAEAFGREESTRRELNARTAAESVLTCFNEELAGLRAHVAAGGSLARELVVLRDPLIEAYVAGLLAPHVRATTPAAGAPPVRPPGLAPVPASLAQGGAVPARRGLLARLFGR